MKKFFFSRGSLEKTIDEKLKSLEGRIFKKEEKEEKQGSPLTMLWNRYYWDIWDPSETIEDRIDSIRKDFNELDHKFDLLERYLQLEYFKIEENTATYDWAQKTNNEGFRKAAKPYEKMKAEKEAAVKESNDCYDD